MTLSVVMISFNMPREIPRTLRSFAVPYQRDIERDSYEVVLVDNGSTHPPRAEDFADLGLNLRVLSYPEPTPSPVRALNLGLETCRGDLIGVHIDGARLASPRLLAAVTHAARLHPRAIIYTQSLMLGHGFQWQTVANGTYDQAVEDELLASIDWPRDGYRLFDISTWVAIAQDESRWVEPLAECNSLFMPTTLWRELDGYDAGFESPGGGMASMDLLTRACALPDVQIIGIAGEATFHQFHEQSATYASKHFAERTKGYSAEYHRLRKKPPRRITKPYWTLGMAKPPYARQDALHASSLSGRYLEILKQALLNEHYPELEAAWHDVASGQPRRGPFDVRTAAVEGIKHARAHGKPLPADDAAPWAYTMIGRKRLDDLQRCAETLLDEAIPGDFVECGVWRGGACILLAGVLEARSARDRQVWLADSFAGLPPPDPATDDGLDLSASVRPDLAVDLESVQEAFKRFDLLGPRVRFVPGWFKDALPLAPIERIALLRLDGDLYSSTLDSLTSLYDKVSRGGFIIVDDYWLPQSARAVDEFRAARGITTPLRKINWAGASWRKE